MKLLGLFGILPVLFGCSGEEPVSHEVDCETFTDVVYTWVEKYADGHLDTVFALDTSLYPGASIPAGTLVNATTSSFEVDTFVLSGEFSDTVFLNYGSSAQDSLVEPRVSIENESEIRAYFDTIVFNFSLIVTHGIRLNYFKNDGIYIEYLDSNILSIQPPPSETRCSYDPCILGSAVCEDVTDQFSDYNNVISLKKFSVFPPGAQIYWQFIVKNRFGYADTHQMESLYMPKTCSEFSVIGTECGMYQAYEHKTIYSWIELYADGHQDTLYNYQLAAFSGYQAELYQYVNDFDAVSRPYMVAPLEQEVCPGDSIWSDGDYYHFIPQDADTLPLNYGDSAEYKLIEPRVYIEGKDSFLAKVDTMQYWTNFY